MVPDTSGGSAQKVIEDFNASNLPDACYFIVGQPLKRRVDGREHDARADRTELAQQTGLAEGFIYDAIDSHLLRHLFGIVDAHWAPDDRMNNYIDIPIDFGHKL
jgi:hypothetical protein